MSMSTERDFKRCMDKQAPTAPATTSNVTQHAPNIHPAETIVFTVDSAVHIVRHTLRCYRCVRIWSGTFVDVVFFMEPFLLKGIYPYFRTALAGSRQIFTTET